MKLFINNIEIKDKKLTKQIIKKMKKLLYPKIVDCWVDIYNNPHEIKT